VRESPAKVTMFPEIALKETGMRRPAALLSED